MHLVYTYGEYYWENGKKGYGPYIMVYNVDRGFGDWFVINLI